MAFVDAAAAVFGPTLLRRVLLANTGTTESVNDYALPLREFVTVVVGATAVRMSLQEKAGVSNAVTSTDILLPANGRIDFLVEDISRFIYVEAADGTSAYQVWIWPSSIKT